MQGAVGQWARRGFCPKLVQAAYETRPGLAATGIVRIRNLLSAGDYNGTGLPGELAVPCTLPEANSGSAAICDSLDHISSVLSDVSVPLSLSVTLSLTEL